MSASTPTTTPPPLRILLLHGYTQTPTLFRHKTSALTKHLIKSLPSHTLSFTYVCGPHKLSPADNPAFTPDTPAEETPEAYGWWRRKDVHHNEGGKERVEIVYEGLEEGLGAVAKAIREEGPFDGAVGFSQGAACAGMLASLLEGRRRKEAFAKAAEEEEEEGRMEYPCSFLSSEDDDDDDDDDKGVNDGFIQPPLKFAVCYSGFRAPGRRYAAFYEPRVQTPILHVLGQLDVVVEEVRARALVSACEGGEGRVVVHPGGHFVPSQKPWLDAVVGFVRGCVEGKEGKGEKEDEKAEDMDVPF